MPLAGSICQAQESPKTLEVVINNAYLAERAGEGGWGKQSTQSKLRNTAHGGRDN